MLFPMSNVLYFYICSSRSMCAVIYEYMALLLLLLLLLLYFIFFLYFFIFCFDIVLCFCLYTCINYQLLCTDYYLFIKY